MYSKYSIQAFGRDLNQSEEFEIRNLMLLIMSLILISKEYLTKIYVIKFYDNYLMIKVVL